MNNTWACLNPITELNNAYGPEQATSIIDDAISKVSAETETFLSHALSERGIPESEIPERCLVHYHVDDSDKIRTYLIDNEPILTIKMHPEGLGFVFETYHKKPTKEVQQ